jgi:hypothetical protein
MTSRTLRRFLTAIACRKSSPPLSVSQRAKSPEASRTTGSIKVAYAMAT